MASCEGGGDGGWGMVDAIMVDAVAEYSSRGIGQRPGDVVSIPECPRGMPFWSTALVACE